MTGEQFVKLCFEEKEAILKEYFNANSQSEVTGKICKLTKIGVIKEILYDLVNLVLKENYYTLLLALDGEAAYRYFMKNNAFIQIDENLKFKQLW